MSDPTVEMLSEVIRKESSHRHPKGMAVAHYKGRTYYGEDAEELEQAAKEGREPRLKGVSMKKKRDKKDAAQKKALAGMGSY